MQRVDTYVPNHYVPFILLQDETHRLNARCCV